MSEEDYDGKSIVEWLGLLFDSDNPKGLYCKLPLELRDKMKDHLDEIINLRAATDDEQRELEEVRKIFDLDPKKIKATKRKTHEVKDEDDVLLGAWSAAETFHLGNFVSDTDNLISKYLDKIQDDKINISDWIGVVKRTGVVKARTPPLNTGKKIKRVIAIDTKQEHNPFFIDRDQLLDEIKINDNTPEVDHAKRLLIRRDNNELRRQEENFNLFSSKYLKSYIGYRMKSGLPWAIGDTIIGFVACPKTWIKQIFNMQDGYFNATYMSRGSDRDIKSWLRTLEGKMLLDVTSRKFSLNGKPIVCAYNMAKSYVSYEVKHGIYNHFNGIDQKTLSGVYIHPSLVRPFSIYLGIDTYVEPCLKYILNNPVRYVDGSSWWVYTPGTPSPFYPLTLKPLNKVLCLWMKKTDVVTVNTPFTIHVSYGDKWYIRRIVSSRDANIVADFYGIDQSDLQRAYDTMSLYASGKAGLKVYRFNKWAKVKALIAHLYLSVDRAYYDYDSLKNKVISIYEEVICVKDKEVLAAEKIPHERPNNSVLFENTKPCDNDFLIGDLSEYTTERRESIPFNMVNIDGTFNEKSVLDKRFKWKDVKRPSFIDDKDAESDKDLKESVDFEVAINKEEEQEMLELAWLRNATSEQDQTPTPTPRQRSRSRSKMRSDISSAGASAGTEYNPKDERLMREKLTRIFIIVYVLEKYQAQKQNEYIKINDKSLPLQERQRLADKYMSKYTDDDLTTLINILLQIFTGKVSPQKKHIPDPEEYDNPEMDFSTVDLNLIKEYMKGKLAQINSIGR